MAAIRKSPISPRPGTQIAAFDGPALDAERIATGFLDAWVAHDADEAVAYLSDAAITEMWGSPERLRAEFAMLEALGSDLTITGCEPGDDPTSGASLRCTYDHHVLGSEEIGLLPFTDGHWDLTIRDGTIDSVVQAGLSETYAEFSQRFSVPFFHWIRNVHPADVPSMYEGSVWRLTDESVRLWERHTREFVESGAWLISLRVGLQGLPPEGPVPSTPERGELVVDIYSHASAGRDMWIFVYADGRVIWSDDTGSGVAGSSSGFLERRLTPDGVELVRDEVLASGLFDPAEPPPGAELGSRFPPYGHISFHNGDEVVHVPYRPDEDWTGEFRRLHERLRDLLSWLPPDAWEDDDIEFFVPSSYAVCVSSEELAGPTEPTPLLSLLPPAARAVLVDAPHWIGAPLSASRGTQPGDRVSIETLAPDSSIDHCFGLATDATRALAVALEVAGAGPGVGGSGYHVELPESTPSKVDIAFIPFMPHGEVECACYG